MTRVLAAVKGLRRPRRGHCIALMALMTPVMIGFTGLCIDLGVVSLVNAQLKTVADAAALAGAKQLNVPMRALPGYDLSAAITRARQKAAAVGTANLVLGQPAVLLDNSSNSASGDVVIGYKNLAVAGSPFVNTGTTSLFNSVRVVARRDANHSGPVPAFFSQVMGFNGTPLNAQSTATVQNYAVQGFKCSPSGSTKLAPITLSKTTYAAMLSGLTSDSFTLNSNGTVSPGADGLYESSMYPVGSGAGNWGTLQIGVGNNGTSTLASQIQNGVTTSDIAASSPTGCSLALNPTVGITGNPGVSLGIKSALQSLVGKVIVVPIYDPAQSSGSGANFTYTIVAFAPVAVMALSFNGVHTTVLVQPALTSYDPTMSLGAAQTSWASGGVVRLRLTE